MAVVETKNPSSMKIRLNVEVDGEVKVRTKSYSNVKPSATTQNVFDVGYSIVSLQSHPMLDIIKQDNTVLSA